MRDGPPLPPPEERGGWLHRTFIRYPWHFGVVVSLVTITAMRPCTRHVPAPPPVLAPIPAFELVDQEGQPFSLDALRGHVTVAGFMFTTCPSTCPKISRAMLDLQRRYAQHGVDVHLVSFSVDPDHDTPAVLKTYAQHLEADLSRWRFVTGGREAMASLVVGTFHSAMDKSADAKGMVDIAHTTKLALIDAEGQIRGYYGSDEVGLDEVFHRSQHVIREIRERQAGCGGS